MTRNAKRAGIAGLALSALVAAAALLWPRDDDVGEHSVAATDDPPHQSVPQAGTPTRQERLATRSRTTRSQPPGATLRSAHERADDLFDFYLQMKDAGASGQGEATYRAALALHECALMLDERARRSACGPDQVLKSFPEKAWACDASAQRCSGFEGRLAEDLLRERDELYAQAADQGYPRAVARQLSRWLEEEPERAAETAAQLLSETSDFGTLYHVGNYLRARLYEHSEPYIGGSWSGERNSPDARARWGNTAWQLAACRMDHGCPEQSIFMRSACLSGDGCQAGWSYEDYIRYYRSPYDMARIESLSNEIYRAMRDRDVATLMGSG